MVISSFIALGFAITFSNAAPVSQSKCHSFFLMTWLLILLSLGIRFTVFDLWTKSNHKLKNPITFFLAANLKQYDAKINGNIDEAKKIALDQQQQVGNSGQGSTLKNLGIFLKGFVVPPTQGTINLLPSTTEVIKVLDNVLESGSKGLHDGNLVIALIDILGTISNCTTTTYQRAAAKAITSALKGERKMIKYKLYIMHVLP